MTLTPKRTERRKSRRSTHAQEEYPRSLKDRLQRAKAAVNAPKQGGVQRMIDIVAKRAEGKGKGCEKWATLYSLKQMATTMSIHEKSGFTSPEELEATRDGLKARKTEKAQKAYREQHESNLIIVRATTRYLKAKDISKLPAPKALQDEIEQLMREENVLYNEYQERKEDVRELQWPMGNSIAIVIKRPTRISRYFRFISQSLITGRPHMGLAGF